MPEPAVARVDRRAVVATVAVVLAMTAVAIVSDGSARAQILQALTYILAFRLVALVYTGRRRNALVVLSVPVVLGAVIGQWWAVALSLVNAVLSLVFGGRRDVSKPRLTPSEVALFLVIEAALLASGVLLAVVL